MDLSQLMNCAIILELKLGFMIYGSCKKTMAKLGLSLKRSYENEKERDFSI